MTTLLLKTRLYVPTGRAWLVSRPHLVERLNEGFRKGCRLTLVSAPAGYGKTTLLCEWIAHRKLPTRADPPLPSPRLDAVNEIARLRSA